MHRTGRTAPCFTSESCAVAGGTVGQQRVHDLGLYDSALDRLRISDSPTKSYAWRRTMDTPGEKCFVEQFHLRSPIEEFEDYSHEALEQLRKGNGKSDEATYREAMALVFRKLRPNGARAIQSRSRSDTP